MQYLGSKSKIASKIIPYFEKAVDKEHNNCFVELFCGGCNITDKIGHLAVNHIIANDCNKYLISMFKQLQKGWLPPDNLTQGEYTHIRLHKDSCQPEMVAFVGFMCSFGGKWFGGYAHNSKQDNYCLREKRVLLKQIQLLQKVHFSSLSYDQVKIPYNSVVYCDPHYRSTTGYKYSFNNDQYEKYLLDLADKRPDLIIFCSEYQMDSRFTLVDEFKVKTVSNKNKQSDYRTERLYRLN